MDIIQATELFNIDNLMDETMKTLKSRYRKLMLKYHPDNCGNEKVAQSITEAYSILESSVQSIESYNKLFELKEQESEKLTSIVTLEMLIQLYEGQNFVVNKQLETGIKTYDINRGNFRKYNIFILSNLQLEHNGIRYNFSNIEPWSVGEEFNVYCNINIPSSLGINSKEHIKIIVNDNIREFDMTKQLMLIKQTLKFNIKLNINIKKILVD